MTYKPIIDARTLDMSHGTDYTRIKDLIEDGSITHVRSTKNEIQKVFGWLNKKSVPLNRGDQGPTRWTFEKIESYGTVEETPAAPAPAIDHAHRDHALLSASGAHRWLNCTPSAVLEDALPDSESEAAAQGTAAHELAEHLLRQACNMPTTEPVSKWHDEEMIEHATNYADFVLDELATARAQSPAAFLSIEQRLDFSHIVPEGFGTGDAMITADDTMTIIDLKYGKGVEVSAVDNPQMKLYALGALQRFGMIYDIHRVRMVIYQPRLDNISSFEITTAELEAWAETVVKPAAQLAADGEGDLAPGDWCGFCRHAPQCPALMQQHFEVVPVKTGTLTPTAPAPDTLTDEQIAQIVLHAGELKKWLTAVEKYALDQANTGHTYTGLKLVEGRSVRKYADEDAVATAVQEAGYNPYEKKLHGLTNMKKLLGAAQFKELVEPHLHKPEGKPTLVPESDKRPALTVSAPENVFEAIA